MNIIRNTTAEDVDILTRVIDACLREDLLGIVSRAKLVKHTDRDDTGAHALWLHVEHLPGGVLCLPVMPADFMQSWKISAPWWWWWPDGQKPRIENTLQLLFDHLSANLDAECRQQFSLYLEEARCAAEHKRLCQNAAAVFLPGLSGILDVPEWGRRLTGIDQVASYADHPFYPTARAKIGFDSTAMRAYAPEYAQRFSLRWIAIPRDFVTCFGPLPAFWPSLDDVGLADCKDTDLVLFPVHPLSWNTLDEIAEIPPGSRRAPLPAIEVQSTLSVRTVACLANPFVHIKLPIQMRTLGTRNLRLIKPGTLHDGHTIETILTGLIENDPYLRGRIIHVDEGTAGHVAGDPGLAFLVRRYPASIEQETPVSVAALSALMQDRRPLVAHLVERFHGGDWNDWARHYCRLLLDVHLRLWICYGIALESNQQNAVLLYGRTQEPRLLMKDNDAARIDRLHLSAVYPQSMAAIAALHDKRISAATPHALGEMFCTITLQLCLAAPFEMIAQSGLASRGMLFGCLRNTIIQILETLAAEGHDISIARQILLEADTLPVKYLLTSGSLLPKSVTGASDINKFYGYTAPNFLKPDWAA